MRAFFALCLLALPLAACSCDEGPLSNVTDSGTNPGRCTKDEDCGPRQGCNVAVGVCFDKDECSDTRPCPEPQVCGDGDGDGFNECSFSRCTEDDECAATPCEAGLVPACVAGGCMCGTPCQGGCPSSQGCCVPDDTCYDLPELCMGLMCPPGQFVSVTSSGAWDTGRCELLGESCRCERLPPLPLGDIGLHSALAHDGRSPIVSAYNLDYGDLMFGTVDADGVTIQWEFVDGVPTSTGSITGDLMGPRGGNSAPGSDVGLYTDLAAAANGDVHLVYVDRDAGDLLHAFRGSGAWRRHTIATAGEAGLYASLALDAQDRPRVAYLGVREDDGSTNARKTILHVAISSTRTPSASGDWVIRDLETTDLAQFGCAEQCRIGEVCRASNNSCVVPDPASRCSPVCSGADRCIAGRCEATMPLPPFRDLPLARGLWPALAVLPDGGLLVAYYDRLDFTLKLARIAGPNPASGAIDLRVLEGGGQEDVGLYPSLFVTPGGEIHLVFVDATRRSLEYRLLDGNLSVVLSETIESGLDLGSDPEGHLLGADPAVVVDANSIVRVAYQDATAGDLRYARRMGDGTWNAFTLLGEEMPYEGTFGFYNDQIVGPDRRSPLVSTYRFFLSAPGGAMNGIVLVTPP